MKVTWVCVCEVAVVFKGPRVEAKNIYLSDLPWSPPAARLKADVLMRLWHNHEDLPPEKIKIRLVDEHGAVHPVAGVKLPQAQPVQEGWSIAWLDIELEIMAPGHYELKAFMDGQALEDAPSWPLRFVEK